MDQEYSKIIFTGDIMCSKVQNEQILAHNNGQYDYEPLFSNISKIFNNAYVCGNLETPVSKGPTTQELARFNTPVQFLKALKKSGFSFLSLANNHAMDNGKSGLIDTIDNVERYSFDHAGTYRSKEDSEQILVKTINGCKVALLSFTYGLNTEVHNLSLDPEDEYMVDLLNRQITIQPSTNTSTLKNFVKQITPEFLHRFYLYLRGVSDEYQGQLDNIPDEEVERPENSKYVDRCIAKIKSAKAVSDILIVCCHVGGQYNNVIGKFTDYITNKIVDAGADFVICNHPHCILKFKKIKSSYVFYSLGNFSYTPNYGYYVTDVYSECSIILSLYPSSNKTIERITYSVAIVRTDGDGISRTYLLYDLIVASNNQQDKERLIYIHNNAIKRFANQTPKILLREYELSIN
ncbi:MAG: CapA family protein [Bacteroidales bacterium]|nr:CapA family protein [Bacteroidales bacterium]